LFATSEKKQYNPARYIPNEEEFLMRKLVTILLAAGILAVLLAACGTKPGVDPAAKAVEDYLSALVNKDSDSLSALSCADWESNALLEYDSLQAVTTRLEGLSCAVSGTDGDATDVTCQGKIIATYNNEDQTLDLSVRTYQVVKQGGDYLVCGYK
jgi:hypothetical protein